MKPFTFRVMAVALLIGCPALGAKLRDPGQRWDQDKAEAQFKQAQADTDAHRITPEFLMGTSRGKLNMQSEWYVQAVTGRFQSDWDKKHPPHVSAAGRNPTEWQWQFFDTSLTAPSVKMSGILTTTHLQYRNIESSFKLLNGTVSISGRVPWAEAEMLFSFKCRKADERHLICSQDFKLKPADLRLRAKQARRYLLLESF